MTQKYKVGVTIQQRQKDGSLLKVEVGGLVHIEGPVKKVAAMLLEAERYGNNGAARIHITMAKDTR